MRSSATPTSVSTSPEAIYANRQTKTEEVDVSMRSCACSIDLGEGSAVLSRWLRKWRARFYTVGNIANQTVNDCGKSGMPSGRWAAYTHLVLHDVQMGSVSLHGFHLVGCTQIRWFVDILVVPQSQ